MTPLICLNKAPKSPFHGLVGTLTTLQEIKLSNALVSGLALGCTSKTFVCILHEKRVFLKWWGWGAFFLSFVPFCDQYSFHVTSIFIGQHKEKKNNNNNINKLIIMFIVVLNGLRSLHTDPPSGLQKHAKFIQNAYKSNLHKMKTIISTINLSFNITQGTTQ